MATIKLAVPIEKASLEELTPASVLTLQYVLKKIGKKAAITLVANEEFAQSYKAQDITFLSFIHSVIFIKNP
jgi:hypothetical protein